MKKSERDMWRASVLNNPLIENRTREDMIKLLDVIDASEVRITKYNDLLRGLIGMVESMDRGMCHPQFKKQYLELARAMIDEAMEPK